MIETLPVAQRAHYLRLARLRMFLSEVYGQHGTDDDTLAVLDAHVKTLGRDRQPSLRATLQTTERWQ